MSIENVEEIHCTTVQVTYEKNGRWHSVELDNTEFLQLLSSGELDNRKVCEIKLLSLADDAEVIYDFVQKEVSGNPWRLA